GMIFVLMPLAALFTLGLVPYWYFRWSSRTIELQHLGITLADANSFVARTAETPLWDRGFLNTGAGGYFLAFMGIVCGLAIFLTFLGVLINGLFYFIIVGVGVLLFYGSLGRNFSKAAGIGFTKRSQNFVL